MSLFPARYLRDEDIWDLVGRLQQEECQIVADLARPEVSTDPERMPRLARRLKQLKSISAAACRLRSALDDKEELEGEIARQDGDVDPDYDALYREAEIECSAQAEELYQVLMEAGHLEAEKEDAVDIKILYYLRRMGAEYAWRLGVNLGIGEVEARERLKTLSRKGLVERVQGTMLKNYHRQRDWTKHMNHTYYRLAREGDHYLRSQADSTPPHTDVSRDSSR